MSRDSAGPPSGRRRWAAPSSVAKHFDHTRDEFSPYGLTCELWGPRRMPRADRHNEVELNFLHDGELTYLMWGERRTVRAERLACFWAAVPHQIVEFEGLARYHVVTIPLAWVLSWGLPDRFVSSLLGGDLLEESSRERAALDAALVAQWEADLRTPAGTEPVLLELRSRLLRFAQAFVRRGTGPTRVSLARGQAAIVEGMARFIAENYTRPITAAHVAASAGLHPDYATRLFRKVYRKGIKAFITEHRVLHAQRLLLSTDSKILAVAMESGFASLSRFNETFRAYCACPPNEYRARHRN